MIPPLDEVTPTTAGPASGEHRRALFTTTHWSVVLEARGDSPAASAALEKLCRIYWWPLYGFVRRQGYKPEEAQDLTKAFFSRLLERRDLETVRRERGCLRSYLLASIKNFLSKARDREMTVKRRAGRPLISLDDALEQLAATVKIPGILTYGHLRLHPWNSLRGDARFEKIVASLARK